MFTPFKLRDMTLANRVVMSPMAQYSADRDGNLTDWHMVHYASHALGGMGLIFTEMTCPSPDSRISLGCPGLWSDAQEAQWTRIVGFVHENSAAKIALQLGHAGRKGRRSLAGKTTIVQSQHLKTIGPWFPLRQCPGSMASARCQLNLIAPAWRNHQELRRRSRTRLARRL